MYLTGLSGVSGGLWVCADLSMCGSVCVCGPVRVSLCEVMCCVSALLIVVLGDVLHEVLAS